MGETYQLDAPVSAADPFADDFLRDPFACHEELREAGPVVWLERYGVWAMARYAEVHEALRDWETFCSSAGVGLSDFRKEKPWRPPSLLLEADPPEHSRARKAVARALSPRTVRALREDFAREAEQLVRELVVRGSVDGVRDIAESFPLRVFPLAIGLTEGGGDQLLAYGNMAFNAFGPRNRLQRDSMTRAEGVIAWIAAHCTREALADGGLGARIYASADEGAVTPEEAALLVRSLLTAGVDTTVIGLGCGLDCLTRPSGGCSATIRPWPARRSRKHCATPRRCRRSSVPPRGKSRSAASPWARGRRCCCSWPPPTAIRAGGTTPTSTTSAAGPSGTSASATGSTPASAHRWPGWRVKCCWRPWPGRQPPWNRPASRAAVSTTP
jgi:hypothetical protein